MKDCLLHIGTNKTGSTTIQQILSRNRRRLRAEGILFPISLGNNGARFAAAIYRKVRPISRRIFRVANADDQEKLSEKIRGNFEAEVADKRPKRVIISSEAACAFANDEVEEAAAYLRPMFDRVRVLAYVRSPLDHLVSNYTTSLLHGQTAELDLKSQPQDFLSAFRVYRSAFGAENCLFRPFYPDAWPDRDFIRDFLRAADLEGFDLSLSPEKKNVSLSGEAQELMRRFNEVHDAADANSHLKRRGLKEFLERSHSGSGTLPSKAEAAAFIERNSECYASLEEEILGGFRFPRSLDRYPEDAPPIDRDKMLGMALGYIDEAAKLPDRPMHGGLVAEPGKSSLE